MARLSSVVRGRRGLAGVGLVSQDLAQTAERHHVHGIRGRLHLAHAFNDAGDGARIGHVQLIGARDAQRDIS